jgi:hypothetical protein
MWLARRYIKSLVVISRLLGQIEFVGMHERRLIGADLSSEARRGQYPWIDAAISWQAVGVRGTRLGGTTLPAFEDLEDTAFENN